MNRYAAVLAVLTISGLAQASESESVVIAPLTKVAALPFMGEAEGVKAFLQGSSLRIDFMPGLHQLRQLPVEDVMRHVRNLSAFVHREMPKLDARWPNQALLKGMVSLALFRFHHIGFEPSEANEAEVAHLLGQAASFGNIQAQMFIGIAHALGLVGYQQDKARAVDIFARLSKTSKLALYMARRMQRELEQDLQRVRLPDLELSLMPFVLELADQQLLQSHSEEPKLIRKRNPHADADLRNMHDKYSNIIKLLNSLKQDEPMLPVDFRLDRELRDIQEHFAAFQYVMGSENVLSYKNEFLQQLRTDLSKLESRAREVQRTLLRTKNKAGRRALTKSDEALLNNNNIDNSQRIEARQVKEAAMARIAQQKEMVHHKLTRPGAQGPNAKDWNEAARTRKANRDKVQPFKDVEFVKLAAGKIPEAPMQTVVRIRNLLRKSANMNEAIEALNNFEIDSDFKKLDDNSYVGLPKECIVYQMKINDRFRAIIPFVPGVFEVNGKQVEMELLYKGQFYVDDPHKK